MLNQYNHLLNCMLSTWQISTVYEYILVSTKQWSLVYEYFINLKSRLHPYTYILVERGVVGKWVAMCMWLVISTFQVMGFQLYVHLQLIFTKKMNKNLYRSWTNFFWYICILISQKTFLILFRSLKWLFSQNQHAKNKSFGQVSDFSSI